MNSRVLALLASLALGAGPMVAGPATAQVESIDPNSAIGGDLSKAPAPAPAATPVAGPDYAPAAAQEPGATPALPATTTAPAAAPAPAAADTSSTYGQDDLIGAAEGVFGKGSKGLALMIQDVLGKQGQPNGYITGREAGGAIVVGLRYGSGTLHHKVEGDRPVYWAGPSIGFDAGANAANTFVLVYNLYDSEDLFKRFAAGEGQAYLVGGFNVSYMRKGDVVLIPVRMGVGLRLGVNGGYMKFSRKQNWVPF